MQFLPALISALVMVESGGVDVSEYRRDGVSETVVAGDNGKALGCLQIHEEVVRDVNRIYGTRYRHKDVLKPGIAKRICYLYLTHYAGVGATAEQCARIWNGGPRGHKKAATKKYWQKVLQFYRG